MSTYSQNLFAVLSEGDDVRPEPVAATPKEENKVAEQPKSDKKRAPKANGSGKYYLQYLHFRHNFTTIFSNNWKELFRHEEILAQDNLVKSYGIVTLCEMLNTTNYSQVNLFISKRIFVFI
jgi:hypothetical protein